MQSRFKSLKVVLSTIVVLILFVIIILLVGTSYITAYDAVEKSYINQLSNFNSDLETQLIQFYETQLKNAEFFAKDTQVVESFKNRKFDEVTKLLRGYFNAHGIYENVFISTAENNPMILAIGPDRGVGSRWGNSGYDDNIKAAINGNSYVSDPNKSPITGTPVVAITYPVKDNNKVIGIVGLACDIGAFSYNLVKGIKIGKTGYPFITSSSGITFAHPEKKNIFTLKLEEYEWGRQALSSPSGTIVRYDWEGRGKILTFVKNDNFRFISASTIYVSDINEDARVMALIMVIFGLAATVIGSLAIYLFISRRLNPLNECRAVMDEMAQGNLLSRYQGKKTEDEIGAIAQSMNNALDQFEKLISDVVLASQNLAQAVEQISSGNQNLSQRTSEQASSLEEIASTIEEASAAINQNADNSNNAKNQSEKSTQMAVEGGKLVEEAVQSINDINTNSKKIGDIITVINEIAFQTNLLALNAAVEAARAGEQGRGFAVVAGEVRNLAQRSGNAATEIGSLIKNSIQMIEHGTEKVNKSGESLKEKT